MGFTDLKLHTTIYIFYLFRVPRTKADDGKIPTEVVIEDKTAVEQLRIIQQLDEEDRQTIFKLIDKMLTNKKFKDFYQKNIAAL